MQLVFPVAQQQSSLTPSHTMFSYSAVFTPYRDNLKNMLLGFTWSPFKCLYAFFLSVKCWRSSVKLSPTFTNHLSFCLVKCPTLSILFKRVSVWNRGLFLPKTWWAPWLPFSPSSLINICHKVNFHLLLVFGAELNPQEVSLKRP